MGFFMFDYFGELIEVPYEEALCISEEEAERSSDAYDWLVTHYISEVGYVPDPDDPQ